MPLWLKWFLFLVACGLAGTFFAPAPGVFAALILLLLILFPGDDPNAPRLVRLAPALWSLSFLSAVTIAFLLAFNPSAIPPEAGEISIPEVVIAIVSPPILIWAFYWKPTIMKPLVAISFAATGVAATLGLIDEGVQMESLLQFLQTIIVEGIFALYLLARFKLA